MNLTSVKLLVVAFSVPRRAIATPSSVPTRSLDVAGAEKTSTSSRQIPRQISFRTKTRPGVRGLLPKPLKFRLWGKYDADEGLDKAKRILHVTEEALIFEIQGENEVLSFARGVDSAKDVVVNVVARSDIRVGRGEQGFIDSVPVDGIFGIYNLHSGPYVAVIRRSKLRYCNAALGVEFRQISKVRLVPILKSPRELDEAQAKEEARLLALLALAFRSHQLYFSHVHDVTNTLQRLRVSADSTASSRPSKLKPRSGAATPRKNRRAEKGTTAPDKSSSRPLQSIRAQEAAARQPHDYKSRNYTDVLPQSRVPADSRFYWNLGVLGPLTDLKQTLLERAEGGRNGREALSLGNASRGAMTVGRWLTPVMSAFVQVEEGCQVGNRTFDVLFVSRRSRLRQGTRFTRRGIDDGGNVANFVETEQSLLHGDRSVTSHVQIRGSIPVLWSSPTNLRYHPKVRIDPDQEASMKALRRHIEDLIGVYGVGGGGIVFVNLVDKKKDQGALGEKFDEALKAVARGAGDGDFSQRKVDAGEPLNERLPAGRGVEFEHRARGARRDLSQSLRHVWFDFHHECRNMHWENLDKLLALVDEEFGEQGFFYAGPSGEVLRTQDGVIRTNCMDCLDRTNVVQSLLARRSMLVQLKAVGVDLPDPHDTNSSTALALTLDMLEMPAEELERRFRDLWGNNADEISILYAGTPALKGDFTRTGKRTKVGLLQDGTNSAIRYVVNNFQDHRRQEAVNLMLGIHCPAVGPSGQSVLDESINEHPDLDLWTRSSAALQIPLLAASTHSSHEERTDFVVDPIGRDSPALSAVQSPSEADVEKSPPTERSSDLSSLGFDIDIYPESMSRRGSLADSGVDLRQRDERVAYPAFLEDAQKASEGVLDGRGGGRGDALLDLRIAGPYSALALTALFFMAARGSGVLSLVGVTGATRVETALLFLGLATLPALFSWLDDTR